LERPYLDAKNEDVELMSGDDNLFSVDQDYNATASNFVSTSGRVGNAAASTQGARVVAGYDPNSLLAPFRLDAGGNIRVAPANPSGGSVFVYNGQTPPAAASQYGQQIMALQPLPTPVYLPLSLDPVGALNVHEKSKATARYIVTTMAGGAAGKSMFSIFNGSTATILRIQQVNIQTPYTYTTGGTLLGLSSPTNQSVVMLHEMRRITGHTKGASASTIGYGLADSNDTVDPLIVALTNATLVGPASNPFHRADANSPSGLPWYLRGDQNQKTLNLRPGEGMSITTVSNTSNFNFDIEVIVTVAPG
jgi:hypothetical protein